MTEIVPNTVFHVMGYGHSNASFIIANGSVILVDPLDTDARGAKLAAIIAEETDKPDERSCTRMGIQTISAAPVSLRALSPT